MRVAIAAAGTGGHVFPALAVAETLLEGGLDRSDILFLGGDRLETTVIPGAGFELQSFELAPLKRSLTLANLKVASTVWRSGTAMKHAIESHRADVMLAMGGYVTGPAAVAARRAGIPLVLHEQNATPGLANRLASRVADDVLVAFPSALEAFPHARVVGNPLRPAVLQPVSHSHACRHYGLDPARPVIGIMGGSQGAAALNGVADDLLVVSEQWQLVHLTGSAHASDAGARAREVERWVVLGFEPEMHFFYAACDVVVARAGALTVSELAATGTPAVLVPYVHGTADHQTSNARVLADAGAAEIVPQEDLDQLGKVVGSLLAEEVLAAMQAAALAAGRPDSAAAVASRVLELAGG